FRLLAVADGHTPAYSPKLVDPRAGPATLKLKPHDLDTRDPARVLRGRVLDEKGQPVPEAMVEPYGFFKGQSGHWGSLPAGMDALALTDASGEFRLGTPEQGMDISVQVNARYRAPRKFERLPAGPKAAELKVFTGATVTGRVVKGGRPLPGVAVGLC